MLNLKVIGVGAAGDKSAIRLIEEDILPHESVLLINSVEKDIPDKYREAAFIYNCIGGCGKEISIGKHLALAAIEDGSLRERIDSLIDDKDDAVIILSSSEGGTGCGGAPVIAKYCNDVIGIPTIVITFTGFEEDTRGLQNTIEFFQSMEPDYVVQAISNKKFLKGNNYNKAAEDANEELCMRIRLMQGKELIASEQNMDRTDLYKSVTTPGFTIINKASLSEVKTAEQFNQLLESMVDNEKSVDLDPDSKKARVIGVVVNIDKNREEIIDQSFSVLKDKIGEPYDTFRQIQYDDDQDEYVAFMAQGLSMPTKEIEKIYKRYKERSEKVDKNQDSFFSEVKKLQGNSDDSQFNVGTMRRRKKNTTTSESFLNQFKDNDSKDKDVITKNY